MEGVLELHVGALRQPPRGLPVGGVQHQVVVSGRHDGDRDVDRFQRPWSGDGGAGLEGEIQPAPGQGPDGEVGAGLQLGLVALVAAPVVGQPVESEAVARGVIGGQGVVAAAAGPAGGLDDPHRQPGRPGAGRDRQHGRREEGRVETLLALGQGQQLQAAAHRVAERDPGARQALLIGVQQQAMVIEIALETLGMAAQPVGQ